MTNARRETRLETVQGQVTVLLVSVGQEPEGLNKELTRLGVQVLLGALYDCEELIDEHHPDLVVLAGSRGAMELASLIEGHEGEDPPRMVIAADRKELAKMVGLNRDVVVSLFATESGDRVLGQRIESLARRAARRRSASIPPPAVKPTAVGLPSGEGVLGKLELKKSPGLSKPAVVSPKVKAPVEVKGPVTPVSKRVASVKDLQKPAATKQMTPSPSLSAVKTAAMAPAKGDGPAESVGKGGSSPEPEAHKTPGLGAVAPGSEQGSPKGLSVGENSQVAPVQVAGESPQSPSEAVSSDEASSMMEVSDSQFLSLRPSDYPEAELELESIPAPGELPKGVGESEDAGKLDEISEKQPVSDFDVSGVERALDGLESLLGGDSRASQDQNTETSSDAVAASTDETSQSQRSESMSLDEPTVVGASSKVDSPVGATESVADAQAVEGGSGEEPAGAAAFAQTMPLAMSPLTGQTSDDSAPSDLQDVEPEGAQQAPVSAGASQERTSALEAEAEHISGLSSKKQSGGKSVAALAVALVALAAGAGIYLGQGNTEEQANAEPQLASASSNKQGQGKPADGAKLAEEASAERTKAPTEAEPKPAAEGDNPDPDPSAAGGADRAEGEQGQSQAATSEGSTVARPGYKMPAAKDPFLVVDRKKPSCETLLNGQVPPSGPDIEHDAAVIWGKARKLIVRGKVDEAHRRMCEAVAINPQSAAVEGLAGLYRDMFSVEQAEVWAKKAEELRPGQRETMLLMGDIYGMRGELEKARETWLSALKMENATKSQIRALSRDYSTSAGKQLVAGGLVKAEIWYRRAAIIDDQNFAALMGLANTFMRSARPKYALAFAYRVLDMSELVPEMQVLVGEVAADVGDKEEARTRFEKALSIRSDFYPAKRGLLKLK